MNIRDRIKSHLASEGEKSRSMVNHSYKIDTIEVNSELEALLLEARLIKKFLPRYNSSAKDDKHPLYIKITTTERYPKVITSRKENSGGLYFGPFPSSRAVRTVLKQIRRVFPYCSQKKITKRPCLYSHLGFCNPCPSFIENFGDFDRKEVLRKEYKKNINCVIALLSGKTNTLKKRLQKEMRRASHDLDFEKAVHVRDQLQAFEYITAPYRTPAEYLQNPNLAEDIRKNELDQLYEILKVRIPFLKYPERMECFDNSHTGGKDSTASMVTFIGGVPDKNFYRQFKIKGKDKNDDYKMMLEAIVRRLRHSQDWGMPDLLVVDGGKGQVSAALEAMRESGVTVPVIGLAKRLEEIIIPKESTFSILRLARDNPALAVLQRLRDEAHRFARKYHFKLRLKTFVNNAKMAKCA